SSPTLWPAVIYENLGHDPAKAKTAIKKQLPQEKIQPSQASRTDKSTQSDLCFLPRVGDRCLL
ncbi:MAG: hypothetical protein VB817_00130, partial [Pirellulaceae bacterium]